ncbi:MAG TPA: cupredoxin domain-containing protein [Acidimicrobiia bacterium]|nr:cupredoxin domain-containing protein [Acidimicrobiia bacterium]
MKHRIALLALVVAMAAVACGDDDTTTTTAATPTTAGVTTTVPAPTTTAGAAGANVSVSNFAFAPNSPEVALGGTVTFTVVSGTHTITSDSGAWAPSGGIGEGSSFTVTPDAAGEFDFFCEFHPSMTGTITVTG